MPITIGDQVDAIVVTWDTGGRNVVIESDLADIVTRDAAMSAALSAVESLASQCHELKQAREVKIKRIIKADGVLAGHVVEHRVTV